MSPHRILEELKNEGVVLKVVGGRLLGPKSMTTAQREIVSANKRGLIAAVTNQCPTCNQPFQVTETDTYIAFECPTSGGDYFELLNKRPGKPMGYFVDYVRQGKCVGCGATGETYGERCEDCFKAYGEECLGVGETCA